MSVDLVKSISIDPVAKTISITSASNNVTPRIYGKWDPLGKGSPFTFESWLRAFARDCFGGSAQFLPSCESFAHEAYLRTCEEMHGDWHQACDRWDFDSAEYEDHRRRWCDRFIDILLNGKRDTRKFHMTKDGATVNVTIRRSQYGGLTGSYRYTSAPKQVSWVRQAVIRREFPFDAIEAQ